MQKEKFISLLTAKRSGKRLKGIKVFKKLEAADSSLLPQTDKSNGTLSVHTFYSFSPYSPSLAAYMAYKSGLGCAGISDHDTLSGAKEFAKACELLGMESSVGLQLRARFYKGKGRWLNSFYEKDIGFVSIKGIPANAIDEMNKQLAPLRDKRVARDRKMVEKFNSRLKKYGITINFDKDVKSVSKYSEGGSVTERHILFAFAQKLIKKFGYAEAILDFIQNTLKIGVEEEFLPALSDIKNPYYAYDLVNCLKHELRFFYVPADDVPEVSSLVRFAHKYGALITYSYAGETRKIYNGEEVVVHTESGYMNSLIKELGELGFDAVEYNPLTLPESEAEKLINVAAENGLFTLVQTDINSPRQRFSGEVTLSEEHIRNMWAVIGSEKCAQYNPADGLNTEKSKAKNPELAARLKLYAEAGKLTLK